MYYIGTCIYVHVHVQVVHACTISYVHTLCTSSYVLNYLYMYSVYTTTCTCC